MTNYLGRILLQPLKHISQEIVSYHFYDI